MRFKINKQPPLSGGFILTSERAEIIFATIAKKTAAFFVLTKAN
ncbi:hypothetical protein J2W55_004643 [Mucilaginibacter pocheonensis]|uniref:Uncharacterized protein n=1 Tax=Mucilaginibacter pocheonensis TaxID=398050 RepID=A0ABU1THG8_9SPHI|nr:hypothetical protein [Mucilaginibacter pocheonensis]